MAERKVLFGAGLGGPMGADAGDAAGLVERAAQADAEGLDLVTVADHPYLGDRLDAYATVSFVLGRTTNLRTAVTVTNPARPAPLLARTVTSLSALSGGRVILGIGAGGMWDMIAKLGVRPLSPGSAVRAMAETITLVRALSGGGDPVTFDGEFFSVAGIGPAPFPAPPVWTGSACRVAGGHRQARGRLGAAARRGLAQPGIPAVPAACQRGGHCRWQGPSQRHRRVQLRRPDHRCPAASDP